MLKIGEFSKLSRISIRMLRHYDEIGLLTPVETDKFSGYRYYSESQLTDVGKITALKDMGFGLSVIGEIMKNCDDKDRLEAYLSVRLSELEEQQQSVSRRIRLIKTARERFRKDSNAMKYDVVLKSLPERYVASVRKTIPSYDCEGMLWSILVSETAPLKMTNADPCYCSVIFYDGEYK